MIIREEVDSKEVIQVEVNLDKIENLFIKIYILCLFYSEILLLNLYFIFS